MPASALQTLEVRPCNQPQTREANSDCRRPVAKPNSQYADEVELYVDNLMAQMLGTERRLSKLRRAMIHGSDMGELH